MWGCGIKIERDFIMCIVVHNYNAFDAKGIHTIKYVAIAR